MIKKLVIALLCLLPLPAFSEDVIGLFIEDAEYNDDQKYLDELNRGDLTNINDIVYIGQYYIDMIDMLPERNCDDIRKLYDIVVSWDDTFTFPHITNNNIEYRYEDEDEDEYKYEDEDEDEYGYDDEYDARDEWSFVEECKTETGEVLNTVISSKLLERGLYWSRLIIIHKKIKPIDELINYYIIKGKIPHFYLANMVEYMVEHDLNNNGYAKFFIGRLYQEGIYFQKNTQKARELFEDALDIQEPSLLYYLALAQLEELFNKQSNANQAGAYSLLEKLNVIKDHKVMQLLETAAEQNNIPANLLLGHFYNEKNPAKSLLYFEKACNFNSIEGCDNVPLQQKKYELSLLLQKLNEDNSPINITKIAQWYEQEKQYLNAINYYSMTVDNDPNVLLKIAELYSKTDMDEYYQKDGIIQSYETYLQYFNDPEIQYKLHDLYSYYEEEWLYWLEEAAKNGYIEAQYKIAKEYHIGFHITQNYSKALYWYNKACTEKNHDRKYTYCQAFYLINKTPNLQENADNGDMEAQYQLALILSQYGYGNFYDIGQSYFGEAAAQGHEKASIIRHSFMKPLSFN